MFSKRTGRLIYFLGLLTAIFALLTKLSTVQGKTAISLLAVGNGHDSKIYFMTIIPAFILLLINSINQFLPSPLIRIITLVTDAVLIIWSITLYFVLEAGASLKTLPSLHLILSALIFFTIALKVNPALDED